LGIFTQPRRNGITGSAQGYLANYWASGQFKVGEQKVTKIVVVMENGQMAGVPWFAVYREETLWHKCNGALLEGVKISID